MIQHRNLQIWQHCNLYNSFLVLEPDWKPQKYSGVIKIHLKVMGME